MPGRVEPEPTREQPRLVPRPDGYADYAEDAAALSQQHGAQTTAAAATEAGGQLASPVPRRRAASARQRPRRRQRSIRSTITMLLVVPLLSLVALWGYSFATTIGGYLANRDNTQVNNDVGGPLQNLLTQLDREAGLTYTLYSMPPAPLKAVRAQSAAMREQLSAQRPKTDAAIAAFRAGQSKLQAAGKVVPQAKPLAAALLAQLRTIPALRAEGDSREAGALTVFEGYNTVIGSIFPYVAAMPRPQSSVPMFSQSMGTLFMGQALTDVATEATLGFGALENGGVLTGPAYRLFEQTVAAQRQLDQSGATMLDIRNANGGDAYVAAIESPQFRDFQALENTIVDDGPDSRLPVTPQSWRQRTQAVLGLLTIGETQERTTVTRDAAHQADVTEYQLFGIGGAGLLAVLVSSLLVLRFGRRVGRELRDLRAAAQGLAFQRLPAVVSRLRAGEDLDAEAEAAPLHLDTKTLEVTETAEAFSAVQRTAVQAAIEQAMLRKAVSNVFRRLARRNQRLLQRQLKMLDEMERGTHDPDALGQLFRLDHLTTRMRRQAEGLIILSGAAPGRGWRQPVQVVEVMRGAIGEIEEYARVDLSTDSQDYVQGAGVADVTHLLAELIENAVAYSPPDTRVQVRGGRVARGYAVEIEDRGLGVPAETLDALNQRLAEPPDFDVADSDQLGLFVVSRLAARHGIKVSLRKSSYGGTTAIVLLPQSLVVTQEQAAYLASQEHDGAHGRGHAGAATDTPAGRHRRDGPGPFPGSPAPAGRRSGPMRALNGPPSLPSRADRPAGAPFPGAAGGHPGSSGGFPVVRDTEGAAGLPHRQKRAGLSPEPREERPGAPREPLPGKSPEQARALLSSIQRGLRTGRNTNVGNGKRPGGWEKQ